MKFKFENSFKRFVGKILCKCWKWYRCSIAIKSLKLKDQIIVPANTWIATAEAVINNGYR